MAVSGNPPNRHWSRPARRTRTRRASCRIPKPPIGLDGRPLRDGAETPAGSSCRICCVVQRHQDLTQLVIFVCCRRAAATARQYGPAASEVIEGRSRQSGRTDCGSSIALSCVMSEGDRGSNALKRRVDFWAARLKVSPRIVRVQRMTRKWGSCSTAGTITLAADLWEQDPGFQDFVIAHELLHLRLPTHGRLFRALLTLHLPNWRTFDVARHCPRSGNNSSSPSREAEQMPRSVISAVTSRAGVTSKA